MSKRKALSRAPRRPTRGSSSYTLALLRALHRDERFRALTSGEQRVLEVAAIEYADGDGWFWPKAKTLADAAGKNVSTVKRAFKKATESGLLSERVPWARPDGYQGSTAFRFDPALTRSLTDEPPCPCPTGELADEPPCPPDAAERAGKVGHFEQRQGGSSATHQNGGTEEELTWEGANSPKAGLGARSGQEAQECPREVTDRLLAALAETGAREPESPAIKAQRAARAACESREKALLEEVEENVEAGVLEPLEEDRE